MTTIMLEDSIAPAVRSAIASRLDALERSDDVRLLMAVESGSHGRGPPSPDSDDDVGFVYVRAALRAAELPARDEDADFAGRADALYPERIER